MDRDLIRLECLKLCTRRDFLMEAIVKDAKLLEAYVVGDSNEEKAAEPPKAPRAKKTGNS